MCKKLICLTIFALMLVLGGQTLASDPNLIVDLDASDLSLGELSTWNNDGSLGGSFSSTDYLGYNPPSVEDVSGRKAVTFYNTGAGDVNADHMVSDFNAPASITGSDDWTVAVWVYNPSVLAYEYLVAWTDRGTSDAANQYLRVGYGSSTAGGAIDRYGADLPFTTVPSANEWYHIAFSFTGGSTNTLLKVYVDGVPDNSVDPLSPAVSIQPDQSFKIACGYWTGNYSPEHVHNPFSGSLAAVQVYDYELSQSEIENLAAGGSTKATSPEPADAATDVSIYTDLAWKPGKDAVSHDVYLGTDYNSVANADHNSPEFKGNQEPNSYDPGTLTVDTTYYWAIDEINESNLDSPWYGDVWSFTTGNPLKASDPYPTNEAIGVDVNTNLSWTPGDSAASHDVYFGTDYNAVVNATHASPEFKGSQEPNTYDPGTMNMETSYYWRIDEVNGQDTWAGNVWNFTTQSPPALKKGPYLLFPGDNTEMTVLWQLEGTSGCSIEWGQNENYSDGSADTTEYGTDHQHKYTITGLTPGNKYYYRVQVGAAYYTGTFYAAPPSSATDVKLLVYGDTRSQPAIHDMVNEAMVNTYEADSAYQSIVLHSGDWVSSDTENAWTVEWFDANRVNSHEMQANIPINGCWGNHEGGGVVWEKYYPFPYVAAQYWSFDYGPVHVAVVDQSVSYSTGSAQYSWLENDLSSSNKDWKFIVLHQPGYSAGGGHGDDTNVKNYIQPLCVQYEVQIVFAGHNHYYARTTVEGVKHITTGGGGAPLYNPNESKVEVAAQEYHYCKVAIGSSQLDFWAVKPDGTVLDSFTLYGGPCTATTMYVESIVCDGVSCGPAMKNGQVTVTIYDNCGDAVSGALVDGTFTGDFNETFDDVATDQNGQAVFTTVGCIKKPAYTFCVDDVTHGSLTYDPNDNVETCDTN